MSPLRLLMLAGAAVTAYIYVPRDAGDLSAAQLARGAQRQLPAPVWNGAQLVAVTAEDETLAFHVDGPTGWLRGATRDDIASGVRRSLCRTERFRKILGSGKSVRVDVSTAGARPAPGELITGCPGGSGGGT